MITLVKWSDWADLGWDLHPGAQPGQQRAVHAGLRGATAPAKHLETILKRLCAGDYSYYHYLKHKQEEAKRTKPEAN